MGLKKLPPGILRTKKTPLKNGFSRIFSGYQKKATEKGWIVSVVSVLEFRFWKYQQEIRNVLQKGIPKNGDFGNDYKTDQNMLNVGK